MKKSIKYFSSFIFIFALVLFNFNIAFSEQGGGGSDPQCDSGGYGSTSCSIQYSGSPGIGGAGGSCSVSCSSNYYSCCFIDTTIPYFHCICKPINEQ